MAEPTQFSPNEWLTDEEIEAIDQYIVTFMEEKKAYVDKMIEEADDVEDVFGLGFANGMAAVIAGAKVHNAQEAQAEGQT